MDDNVRLYAVNDEEPIVELTMAVDHDAANFYGEELQAVLKALDRLGYRLFIMSSGSYAPGELTGVDYSHGMFRAVVDVLGPTLEERLRAEGWR